MLFIFCSLVVAGKMKPTAADSGHAMEANPGPVASHLQDTNRQTNTDMHIRTNGQLRVRVN